MSTDFVCVAVFDGESEHHQFPGEVSTLASARLAALCSGQEIDQVAVALLSGLTVLHIAVTEAQENMVNYLLQRKPELASIPDSDGVLPIQYAKAADDRNEEIVNLLAVGDFFPQNDSIMLVLALHTRSPRFCIELYLSPYTYSTDRSNVSESVCLCTERRTLLDTDAGTLSDTFCL